MTTTEVLFSVKAPHFVAGIVICDEKVARAAPIVHYMKGWDITRASAYCNRKGWEIGEVPERLQGRFEV